MFKVILFVMIILMGGCNIPINQPQPPTEEKKVVQETGGFEPWPEGEKQYWIARYFFTMAADPRVQQLMKPRDAYEIVVCTVNKYEEEHSWEWFTMFLHDNRILQPEIEQYVYDTTKICAVKQKAKTDAKKPLDVKESI